MRKSSTLIWIAVFGLIALFLVSESSFAAEIISVKEIKICKAIEDREPVDAGKAFPADCGKLYCFTRIYSEKETSVQHIWYQDGQAVFSKTLHVGISNGWRTNTSKTIFPGSTGDWTVEVLAEDGTSLAAVEFEVN